MDATIANKNECGDHLGALLKASGCRVPYLAAEKLLAEFGSLSCTLSASTCRQMQAVSGDAQVVEALSAFRRAMLHVLRSDIAAKPFLGASNALLDYLRVAMAFGKVEQVRIIYLNARNILLRDEVFSEGTIDRSAFYVREIVSRALELGSAAIIVVHNHPSGSPEPSRSDIDITRRLAQGCKIVDVELHDHLIVASEGYTSFRSRGLL